MESFKNHAIQTHWKMQQNEKIITGITKKQETQMTRKCDNSLQLRFQTHHTKQDI